MKKEINQNKFTAGKTIAAVNIVIFVLLMIVFIAGYNISIISEIIWDVGRGLLWVAMCIFTVVCACSGNGICRKKGWIIFIIIALILRLILSCIKIFNIEMSVLLCIITALSLTAYTLICVISYIALMMKECDMMRLSAVLSIFMNVIFTICFTIGVVNASGLYAINAALSFFVILIIMIPISIIEIMSSILLLCFAKRYGGNE